MRPAALASLASLACLALCASSAIAAAQITPTGTVTFFDTQPIPMARTRVAAAQGSRNGNLQITQFYHDAFPGFTGGVFVGSAYANRDAFADILVAASQGGGAHVRVFDGLTLAQLDSFYAYDPGFRGGVSVAAADVNVAAVPEPATASLLALGGAGLALAAGRRERRRRREAETH